MLARRKHRVKTLTVRRGSHLSTHRTGDRRLRAPEPSSPYRGLYYVQSYGNACPQQYLKLPNGLDSQLIGNINQLIGTMYEAMTPTDEDCEYHATLSQSDVAS